MLNIVIDYDQYVRYSDLHSNVIFGCDCGCGGDYYKALAKFNELCNTLDIENDLEQ